MGIPSILWIVLVACSGDAETTTTGSDSDTTSTETGFDTDSQAEIYWPWSLPNCVPTSPPTDCATSTPILITVGGVDVPSGFAWCDDTCDIHRTHDADPRPVKAPGDCRYTDDAESTGCTSDAECGSGRCITLCSDLAECGCLNTCRSDSNCDADEYCDFLGIKWHGCRSAGCRTDADCPTGELCRRALVESSSGAGSATLQCTTPKDSCDEGSGEVCAWVGDRFAVSFESTWTCDG